MGPESGSAGGIGGVILALIYLAILVLMIASMWKLFVKMGKPGWAAIVPFYNYFVLTEALKKPIIYFIGMLIPFVNMIVSLILMWELVKSFGKGAGFFVATLFFGFITLPMLAFGDATFTPPPDPAP